MHGCASRQAGSQEAEEGTRERERGGQNCAGRQIIHTNRYTNKRGKEREEREGGRDPPDLRRRARKEAA